MDRLKFRLWNKKDKLYENQDDLYYYCIKQDGSLVLTEDGGCDMCIDVDNFIIEQCTGLKDKNGNLIYEGDIVLFEGDVINRVVYDVEMAKWILIENFRDSIPFAEDENLGTYKTCCYEIIGNIHENKELLND